MRATTRYSNIERRELAGLARNLRRAKRQMFLKEVEAPQNSVDCFRDLLTRSVISDLNGSSSSFTTSSMDFTEEKKQPPMEFPEKKLAYSPMRRTVSMNALLNAQGPRAA